MSESLRAPSRLTCAIYTRKSSEEGLEQDFNSLHAQREACAAFIQSQKSLGWVASSAAYDDGGYSGGNTERPGLQKLLDDIRGHRIKVVVVYKVDRLTRSLADFAKLVELFDEHGVSFVSVTQQFNTTTSMGRLTLNVLLSFAQFEREVTGERIRDKIAASKRKGMWMGGVPPMGYVPRERSLSIDEPVAQRVREIYTLYLDLGSVRELKAELDRRGWVTPPRKTRRPGAAGSKLFGRGHLYRILSNPIYVGKISHKGELYPGSHPPLIDAELWQEVQNLLAANRQGSRDRTYAKQPSLLAGLVFDGDGQKMVATHAQKKSRRYRYYVSANLLDGGAGGKSRSGETQTDSAESMAGLRVPAHELETAVITGVREFLADEARLLEWLDERDQGTGTGQEAHGNQQVVDGTTVLARAKIAGSSLARNAIQALPDFVQRIMVRADQVDIALRARLLTQAQGPAGKEPTRHFDGDMASEELIWVSVPVKLKKAGGAVKLVLADAEQRKSPEKRLLDLLAQAHDWFGRLTSGKYAGVGEIAEKEGVTASYVTRMMYLAFLSPDIVERLVTGKNPAGWTAERLVRELPLPSGWDEQMQVVI